MLKKQEEIQTALDDFQKLLRLWLEFRTYFQKSFTNEPISHEDEQRFLEIKSAVAKYHRTLAQRFKDDDFVYYGGDQLSELLRQSISVMHIRGLPIPDRRTLYQSWHYVYIYLARMVGALRFVAEGYIPLKKLKESSSVSSIKSMAGSRGERQRGVTKKDKLNSMALKSYVKILVILGVLIAIIVFYVMPRLR
jgi:hypothetical protein